MVSVELLQGAALQSQGATRGWKASGGFVHEFRVEEAMLAGKFGDHANDVGIQVPCPMCHVAEGERCKQEVESRK